MIPQRRRDPTLPLLVLIAAAIAALSIWVALTVQPAHAAPAESVATRGWTHETFGRLVFDWTRPVEYSARLENGRLVVEFDRPAAFAFGRALPHLTGYLKDATVSPDGRRASFALVGPVTLKSFTDGPKVVIDLRHLPRESTSAGVAASAPAQAAPAAPAAAGAVRVRAGEHSGFSRLVFDWPEAVPYQITRQGDVALVSFARSARLDLTMVQANLPKALRGIEASTMADRVVARLTLPAGATLRDSRAGTAVVLDIAGNETPSTPTPQPAPSQPAAPQPAAPQSTAPKAGYASAPPAPAETPAPGTPVQLVPPVKAAAVSATPTLPTAPAAPATSAGLATAAAPAQPGTTPGTKAAPEKNVASAPAPGATQVTAVTIEADEEGARLRVPWSEPVNAAAFRRAGVVWVVFDRPARFDLRAVTASAHPMLGEVSQLEHDAAGILQFAGDHVANPHLTREGSTWTIDFHARGQGSLAEIPQRAETDGAGAARLVFAVPNPSAPLELRDPEVGDRLIVVAVSEPGSGISEGRDWPDLSLLPTQQGIVVAARSEGITAQSSPSAVVVTRSGGLLISREAAGSAPKEAELAAGEAKPARLFDLAAWRREDMDFTAARQALQQAIVAAAPDRQNIARLDLARFYFAHGLAAEAGGLLELIARSTDGLRNDPELLLMAGASQLLQGDVAKARELIGSRALDGEAEAELWRGALAAEAGDWNVALADFSRSAGLISDYPHVTRARLQLLSAEARIEAGDLAGALADLDALRQDAPTPDEAAQLAFLDGLRALEEGRPEDAEAVWQGLTESNHQPTRARAIFQLTELELERGEITLADAAERLERLRFLWRGGPFEFTVMRRLGEIYIADGKPREGLRVLRQAVTLYPQHRDAQAVAGRMADAFKSLYLGEGNASVPPLLAVALYDEFKELTPAGAEGDRLVAGLADRLVEVDLLDRADALLAEQIRYRLRGVERARTGARLAEIRLMDQRPEEALEALLATGSPGEPDELSRRRLQLQARALFESGRSAEALALLEGDSSRESTLARADMLWQLGEWQGAADALGALLQPADGQTAPAELDSTQAGLVLNRAIALTLAGDRPALQALAATYGPAMAQTSEAEPFELLTDAIDDDMATRSIAEQLAAATRLQDLVEGSRATQTANLPPTS